MKDCFKDCFLLLKKAIIHITTELKKTINQKQFFFQFVKTIFKTVFLEVPVRMVKPIFFM